MNNSSADVNWQNSEVAIDGKKLDKKLRLSGGLVWNRGGFKYLGIYLGDEIFTIKTRKMSLKRLRVD